MDHQEVDKDTGANSGEIESNYIPGKPYSKLHRELKEEDLSNPAVQKLLLSEIDKLEIKVTELENYRVKYHELDKLKAVLDEKLKAQNTLDILYSVCLAIGSALIGVSSLVTFKDYGWIFLLFGIILIVVGLVSKYRK